MAYPEGGTIEMLSTPELVALARAEVVVESGEQIVRDILSAQIQKLDADGLTKVAQFMRQEGLNG